MNLLPPIILRQGFAVSGAPIADKGLQPQNRDVRVIARTTVNLGEVLMFDMAQTNGSVASATIGASDGSWRNVINPTDAGIAAGYPLCVATEAIVLNTEGVVRVQGVVDANLNDTLVLGDQLHALSSGLLAKALSAVNQRVVAWALASGTTKQSVYFDGLQGGMGAVQHPLPTGLQVANVDINCTNRTGTTMVIGDVVMLDMVQADGATTNATLGSATSCWANVLVPTTAAIVAGLPLCVALEATVNDAVGQYRIEGIVDAKMAGTNVLGDDLVGVNAALTFDKTVAATEHVFAVALEAGTGVLSCWLRGVGGFGGAA